MDEPIELRDLRRATVALALELPGPVYDDYSRRLNAALAVVMSSDRAGVHTSGTLNREATVAAVQSYLAAPSWAHSPYLGVQASEIVALVLDGPSA